MDQHESAVYNSLVSGLWSAGGAGLITLVHMLVVLASFIMMLTLPALIGATLSPGMADSWPGLGQSLILQKQITKGTEYTAKAARITPRSSRVWLALFQTYRLTGDEKQAREAANRRNQFFKADKVTVEARALKDSKKPVEKPVVVPAGQGLELPNELT